MAAFADCETLASSLTPETWPDDGPRLFALMLEADLDRPSARLVVKAAAKALGVPVADVWGEWKATLAEAAGEESPEPQRETQADRLVRLALADTNLFHAPDGTPYADLRVDGHRETHALRSRAFKAWLGHRFYLEHDKAPGSQALHDALGVLEGRARFEGEERAVFVRLASLEGRVYLDLGRPDWEAVKIDPSGWRVVAEPPVRFRRPKSLMPLPVPVAGGELRELQSVLNLAPDTWPLIVAWLVGCLSPEGPYPLLELYGEQGTAKTTTARFLKALVDPSAGDVRAAPRDEGDLLIAASGGWVLGYDNISTLSPALSDALCRLSTGGALGKRELYSDAEEVVLEAKRPVILTGIEELASRADLLDRAVRVELPIIPEAGRRPEREVISRFEAVRPRVLGALLTAASRALRERDAVRLERLPRMADFAVWVTAAEPALGLESGDFLAAYEENRAEGSTTALESSPVPPLLFGLLAPGEVWEGTVKALLEALEALGAEHIRRRKDWPGSPKALAGVLRRLGPVLRGVGVGVTLGKRGREGVPVRLERTTPERGDEGSSQRSPSTPARATREGPREHPASSGGETFTPRAGSSLQEAREERGRERGEHRERPSAIHSNDSPDWPAQRGGGP